MKAPRAGFTLVEVLIAIIMLTIGVMALASSAGSVTRMMMNGQRKTRSLSIAASTLDSLRQKAYSASPKCSGLVSGSSANSNFPSVGGYGTQISRAWDVQTVSRTRVITVTTAYQAGPFRKGDTLRTVIYPPCP